MATPTTPPPPRPTQPNTPTPTQQSPAGPARTPDWMHYGALGAAILGPIALFTPPRRVGLQALLLATGTSYAINILAYDYTGESIYQRSMRRASALGDAVDGGGALPDKALRTKELLRLERERREAGLPAEERERLRAEREARELAQRGLVERLWMGGAKEGWKEERARKEREALEQGKGYGDLIVEQVKEVFTGKTEGEGEGVEEKGEKQDGQDKKP